MPINNGYYGSESTWIDFKPDNTIEENFKVANFSAGITIPTYGESSKTWLAAALYDIQNWYRKPLDPSYGWAVTDGSAPFDSTYYATGWYNNKNRKTGTKSSPTTVGLQIHGQPFANVFNNYAQYYKSSATGGSSWNSAPLNYRPSENDFSFTPVRSQSGDYKYLEVANASIAPVLKFDFKHIFYIPIIDYYLLKDNYTVSDWENATTVAQIQEMIQTSVRRDLRSFYEYVRESEVGRMNHIVIERISLLARYIKWQEVQGQEAGIIGDMISGSVSTTTGSIAPLLVSNGTIDFQFEDWYETEDAEQYNVKLNLSLIDNYIANLGTGTGWNENTNSNTTFSINVPVQRTIAGLVDRTGNGYYNPTEACYNISPVVFDTGNFTIRTYTDQTELNMRNRNYITAYTTIGHFGGIDAFREYCRKAAAYTGGYFSESYIPNWHSTLDDPTCFLGIIDGGGATHGEYCFGEDNLRQPQSRWGEDWASKTPYNPNTPGGKTDPNRYLTNAPTLQSRSISHFGQYYCGDSNDLSYLNAFLNKIKGVETFNTYDEMQMWLQNNFLTSNPADNIIGLKWYPFDTATFIGANTESTVKLGRAFVNVTDYKTSTNALSMLSTTAPTTLNTIYLGHFEPLEAFGDFRDYSPYSEAMLYLPYCGTTTFPLSYALSKDEDTLTSIYVQYKVDITTGSCTAYVTKGSYNGLPIATAHGSISIDIPVNATQQANYQNGVYQAISNLRISQLSQKQNLFSNGASIIEGAVNTLKNMGRKDPSGALNSGWSTFKDIVSAKIQNDMDKVSVAQNSYNLQTQPVEKIQIGNSSAGDGSLLYQMPMLFITRPVLVYKGIGVETSYGVNSGHCNVVIGYLSQFEGKKIKCSTINFRSSMGATQNEQEQIKAALTEGLFIN